MINTATKTLFISDLHLDSNHPAITEQFLSLLKNCDSTINGLYILGDLFEAWIGDDDTNPFHQQIIQALKAATQKGLSIYFIAGNRDFLIGKKFLQQTGCQLLPDATTISVYQTPVLLMHGDTLCTRDTDYLRARKILRQPILQKLFLLLPLKIRQKIAEKMRVASKQHTQSASMDIMDVTQSEVERVMLAHQVYFLIHGHTHLPNTHTFSLNQTTATRVVLAAWHDYGRVFVWDSEGNKSTVKISDFSTSQNR